MARWKAQIPEAKIALRPRRHRWSSRSGYRWTDSAHHSGGVVDWGQEWMAEGRPVRRASRHSLRSLRGQTEFSLDWVGWPWVGGFHRHHAASGVDFADHRGFAAEGFGDARAQVDGVAD